MSSHNVGSYGTNDIGLLFCTISSRRIYLYASEYSSSKLLERTRVASNKRQKQLDAQKEQRQAARQAEKKAHTRRITVIAIVAVVAIALLIAAGLAVFNRNSEQPTAAASDAPSSSLPVQQEITCESATATNHTGSYKLPATKKLPVNSVLVLNTNCGEIDIALEPSKAPITTTAIDFLAQAGWYNNNPCPRLTTAGIYVIQCGSGNGDGTGGPGFHYKDENLPQNQANNYPRGTVAMANAGPNTNDSQFFLVYRDTSLPPAYTVFGKVIKGLDILDYVAAQGVAQNSPSPSDGPPAQPLIIKTASVRN